MPLLSLPKPLDTVPALVGNKPLDDKSFPADPIPLSLSVSSPALAIKNPADSAQTLASFTFSANASASLRVINDNKDPDTEGFFQKQSASVSAPAADPALPCIEAPLSYDDKSAYVVLNGLTVTGGWSGSGTLGTQLSATLGLEGNANLALSSCTRFDRQVGVRDAFQRAITSYGTVFSEADLLALPAPSAASADNPYRVLGLSLQGHLGLSFKLAFSHLASALASVVSNALSLDAPLKLSDSATLKLAATASVDGGFRLFAHRETAGELIFGLRKADSTSLGLNAGAGLVIKISDSDLSAVIDEAVSQVSGVAASLLGKLKGLDAVEAGDGETIAALKTLADKLGFDGQVDGALTRLKAKLSELKDSLKAKVTLSFSAQLSYTWKRLTSESLVARVAVPDSLLPQFHAALLRLDCGSLMDAAASGNGVRLLSLLGRKLESVEIGYGFSLSLGDYTLLKSWDTLQQKFIETRVLAAATTSAPVGTSAENPATASPGVFLYEEAFLGKRAYTATLFSSSLSNGVELDASTSRPLPQPGLSDFERKLTVSFSWKGSAFADLIEEVCDHAALLRLGASPRVTELQSALVQAGLDLTATGDVQLSVSVGEELLGRLLPVLTGSRLAHPLAPLALARALPHTSAYPERNDVERRMSTYAPVMESFLENEMLSAVDLQKICAAELAKQGASPKLQQDEYAPGARQWTVALALGQAGYDALGRALLDRLPVSFQDLAQKDGDFRKLYPDCVRNYSPLAAQGLGCRVLAGLFLLAADEVDRAQPATPSATGQLVRQLSFTWSQADKLQTVQLNKGSL